MQSMLRGSSLLLEGESHQLFCRVFLDETLGNFCWEDDDLRSNALPLEYVDDIVALEDVGGVDDDSDSSLPVFALILSNAQVLKVTCPNLSEFQLWFHGLHRLLSLPRASNQNDSNTSSSPRSNTARASSQSSHQRHARNDHDEVAAALAPYDYAEDNEEYGDGHAVSNTFSPHASTRSDASHDARDAEGLWQQMHAVQQRLAEAEAALRVFDGNSASSKASGGFGGANDDTPPAPSQSPSYKKFQPKTLAVDSHHADTRTGRFYDESESVDTEMYASTASKDDEEWRAQDDADSTSGYTSTSHDTATQAESQLSAMQNSILLLCDQVQELRGKLNSSRSRPSSSQKSKLDELARAKRELARVREENEALAMRCRELSMMQSPQKLSDVQQVRRASRRVLVQKRAPTRPLAPFFHSALQEEDLQDLKEEVQRLNGMLQTAVTVNARRQADVRAFKESVTRLLIEKGIVDTDEAL